MEEVGTYQARLSLSLGGYFINYQIAAIAIALTLYPVRRACNYGIDVSLAQVRK